MWMPRLRECLACIGWSCRVTVMACSEGAPLRGARALRLLAINDLLLMGLDPGTTNLELWRSDGSVKDGAGAGLFKLAGLIPGPELDAGPPPFDGGTGMDAGAPDAGATDAGTGEPPPGGLSVDVRGRAVGAGRDGRTWGDSAPVEESLARRPLRLTGWVVPDAPRSNWTPPRNLVSHCVFWRTARI